ncbi:MAG: chromosome segregation protein SMC [Thermodesulfobacteriota bacterium]
MRIKKIEVAGFKSFSDKIEIGFPPGVTAIVGPNGCGKSNVVDAIRWALGEQSAKQLRGKSMEDVIFNGSENKKPLGMAEVTLTFSSENGHPHPAYPGFTEISISRRLFRSGESEYYINKVPCRLKDIIDLFMGTGIGHRAYSIVEQGKIDFVINAKPEERRVLIEEAAGITKYKDRKNAALRKMEATQQNLLRLQDVIGEIRRQLNSLNRQAKKAERYKEYREEMRSLELGQIRQKYQRLRAQREEAQLILERNQDEESKINAAIAALEVALEKIKLNLLESEQELAAYQKDLMAKEKALKDWETTIELALQEEGNLQKQVARAQEEISKLQRQQEESEKEISTLEAESKNLAEKITNSSAFLKEQEEILQEKKIKYAEFEKKILQAKNSLIEHLTQLAHFKNHLLELQKRREEASWRRQKTIRQQEETQKKLLGMESVLSQIAQDLSDQKNRRCQLEELRNQKILEINHGQEVLRAKQQYLAEKKERLHRESSRLHSLIELQRNFEGYQEGVRAILLKKQAEEVVSNGILGLVEDIIETEPRYENLVEMVLSERLQNFIVANHQESLKAIDYLKTNNSGRCTFIPLQLKPKPYPSPAILPEEGIIPILNLVRVKEEFAPLIHYLLDDIWVVPNLTKALELWHRDSLWKILVTYEGEILYPSGIITGGPKEQKQTGTFHRKREIRELTRSTENLTQEIGQLEKDLENLKKKDKDEQEALAEIDRLLHQQELEMVKQSKELDQYQIEKTRLRQEIEVLQLEEKQLAEEIEHYQEEMRVTENELKEGEIRKKDKEEEIKKVEQDWQILREEIERINNELTGAKVALGAQQEKKQNLDQNLRRLKNTRQEIQSLLEGKKDEIADCIVKQEAARERRKQAESAVQETLSNLQKIRALAARRQEDLASAREKLAEEENQWKEKRQELQILRDKKNDLSMQLMEIDLQIKHLLLTGEEKFRVDLNSLPPLEEGEDYFAPQIETRMQELKSLMEAMGEVNLLAIQEFAESKARLDFLTEQEADLKQSLESLNQAIKKINRTSRQRFAETFQKVNEKFKEIFTTLFRGGRAELVLVDETNLLETGVEIIAQPPGKRLQNISLLSGGEKALTAIALIFALFLINPSPFCLLDEVDSPLDDANIGRFNKLIKDLAQQYQIILVTHNKRTMELADTLYGVTMEEAGVSKLVSVKLN